MIRGLFVNLFKNLKYLFLLCIGLVPATNLNATSYQFERPNKTISTYYLDKSNTQDSFSIVLMLQGSETNTVRNFMNLPDDEWLEKINAAVLAVEKPGVTQDGFDRKIYLSNNSLWQRAEDCMKVVERLRDLEPNWNGNLLIVGGSEGATLAAYLSPLIPETKATIMFSGGCGMSLHDELQVLENKRTCDSIRALYSKYSIKAYVYAMIALSKWFPNSAYTCIGENNTLKYWNTIGNYNPLTSLEKLSIPLYLVHGTHDTNCPIESAEKLVNHFNNIGKTNLTYRSYPGYDHNFFDEAGENHWIEVSHEAFEWSEVFIQQR